MGRGVVWHRLRCPLDSGGSVLLESRRRRGHVTTEYRETSVWVSASAEITRRRFPAARRGQPRRQPGENRSISGSLRSPPQAPSPFEMTSVQNRPATDGPSAEAVACSPMRADSHEGANLDGDIQARPACLFRYLGEGAMTADFRRPSTEVSVARRRASSPPPTTPRRPHRPQARGSLGGSLVTMGRRIWNRPAAARWTTRIKEEGIDG